MDGKRVADVIVIGGGHAGIEASAAAARMGAKTVLITMDASKIGAMHCNPSVGGLGKSHLTYEVSALGGMMPKFCTQTYLQAKMLNTSKGPAVQGLRLQIDKIAYQRLASQTMANLPNLEVLETEVVEILHRLDGNNKIVAGVKTANGLTILAPCVVITTGTFLNSAIYVGKERCNPVGNLNPSSNHLTRSIEGLIEMKLGRLKTGTPPRLLKSSLDFSKFEYQPAHQLDYLFEFDPVVVEEKAPCYITHTTAETTAVIAENLLKAGYNPERKGMEPRYCPSIETKVFRFPNKHSHHVFVEPESLELDEIYPAGISNSLPADVQLAFVRTIPGFEKAELVRPGFMIEYDFLQPNNLRHTLEHKQVRGLFFAGQVNGTTGYEEAAAQGILAGINAALLASGREQIVLSRNNSYIGIMVDDLVTLGVDEPYRMFTSRAERRLSLRQDNVFERIMPLAEKLGLIDDQALLERFHQESLATQRAFSLVKKSWGRGRLFELLHTPDFQADRRDQTLELLKELFAEQEWTTQGLTLRAILSVYAQVRYDGYLDREELEIVKAEKYAQMSIPADFVYDNIAGLSNELKQKLNAVRPATIAQAQLIPAMTPAAISLLIFQVKVRK